MLFFFGSFPILPPLPPPPHSFSFVAAHSASVLLSVLAATGYVRNVFGRALFRLFSAVNFSGALCSIFLSMKCAFSISYFVSVFFFVVFFICFCAACAQYRAHRTHQTNVQFKKNSNAPENIIINWLVYQKRRETAKRYYVKVQRFY